MQNLPKVFINGEPRTSFFFSLIAEPNSEEDTAHFVGTARIEHVSSELLQAQGIKLLILLRILSAFN